MVYNRKNEIACKDPELSQKNPYLSRKKRNAKVDTACAGDTTIKQKSSNLVLDVVTVKEPEVLTEYNGSLCQSIPGYNLFELKADMNDYDGSKYEHHCQSQSYYIVSIGKKGRMRQ